MKIGFFDAEGWESLVLKKKLPREKFVISTKKLVPKKDLEGVSVLVTSKIGKKELRGMPKLKMITTRSTGFDHIDLEACRERGVKVYNVPFYGANTVAEQAFTLLLGLSRRLVESVERTRRRWSPEGLRGFDLKEKVLGVVGTGNIGRHAVKMGLGFGMKVVAFDLYPDKKFAKEMGFKYVSLEALLKQADVVTLHVPLNKHTHHLLNKKRIGMMKKGAYLINTSRGGVVDTIALLAALKNGRLGGAGLDVLEGEELMRKRVVMSWKDHQLVLANKRLIRMKNVLVTPHNAFNTKEAVMRIMETTVENIKTFKKGGRKNLVK